MGGGGRTLTFEESGVLDVHLQLSEENVLCGALAQVSEDLEGSKGAGGGCEEASFAVSCSPRAWVPHHPINARF